MVASSLGQAWSWLHPAARAFAADGERRIDRIEVPPQPLESRVEDLERRVTNLEQLPARVDNLASQILHLRTEMHVEFSAVRTEAGGRDKTLRQVIAEQATALRQEMVDQGSELRQEIAVLRQEMVEQGAGLHAKIDGLATHMRVLHEEVIARIALLGETSPRTRSRRRKNQP
jgi:phosphoglycerate-specific signal transduction histidine kinase